jgi:hypothetical protein
MENRRPQSHIDSVAFDAASLSRESASNLRKRASDEPARMAARRRSCLSLAKHVASAMKSVCDCKFVVRRGVVLEHVPETSNPTTWVDCLAASPFGVFVVNQYDWTGSVTRSRDHDELLVRDDFGVASVQISALSRGKTRLAILACDARQMRMPGGMHCGFSRPVMRSIPPCTRPSCSVQTYTTSCVHG